MNIFRFFTKHIRTVRASSKAQREAAKQYDKTHMKLAQELGLDVEFRARMGEIRGVK